MERLDSGDDGGEPAAGVERRLEESMTSGWNLAACAAGGDDCLWSVVGAFLC